MLLGVKPCASLIDQQAVAFKIKELQEQGVLPDDYVVGEGVLYSKSKVEQTVSANPEAFGLTTGANFEVEDIIANFFNTSADAGETATYATGMLLGYPADAAQSYSKYDKHYQKFFNYALAHRDADVVFKRYTAGDVQDNLDDNFWRDGHKDLIKVVINQVDELEGIPQEAKDYIINARSIQTRGFDFRVESSSPQYSDFKNFAYNTSLLFYDSGIDKIYNKYRE